MEVRLLLGKWMKEIQRGLWPLSKHDEGSEDQAFALVTVCMYQDYKTRRTMTAQSGLYNVCT